MILLDADDVLAVAKPPGLSMATSAAPATSSRKGKSEADVVARLLEACGAEDVEGPLHLVHRLDVGTSGVVLLARSAGAHRALSLAFQERRARKTYRALVWGRPVPARGVLDEPLGRDPKDGRKMRTARGGKPAVTRYATLRRLAGLADLELRPETGRTHQIRVHLAAKGHPVVGDDLYGGATRWHGVHDRALREALSRVTRPLLHAARIEVPELRIDVTAPLPRDYAGLLALLTRADVRSEPGER